MEITYVNNKLRKQLTQFGEVVKAYGQLTRKINQRHEELKAATSLSVMRLFPSAGCHELVGDRKGLLAIKVSGNYRLLFRVNHSPVPLKEDGGLDWDAVTAITIVDIEDYH